MLQFHDIFDLRTLIASNWFDTRYKISGVISGRAGLTIVDREICMRALYVYGCSMWCALFLECTDSVCDSELIRHRCETVAGLYRNLRSGPICSDLIRTDLI